jgi:CBS domain-containing protein
MVVPFGATDSMFVFFSQIQGVKVLDAGGSAVGVFHDIIIEPMGKYAKAKALIIAAGSWHKSWAALDWACVKEVSCVHISLRITADRIKFCDTLNHKTDLSLRQDILDQQVVDTNNQNVIRVNDIHLLIAEQDLVVAHVDIGLRGIVRRLGYENLVDTLVRFFNKDAAYLTRLRFISWKYVQPLSLNPVSMTIKVDVAQSQLAQIPAADLSEIMLDLPPQHRVVLFKTLDTAAKIQLFTALEIKEQKSLLEDLGERDIIDLLNRLPTDEAVDFLGELPSSAAHKMLGLMETKNVKMLSTLLGYSGESAAGLMTTEYIAVPQEASIEEALKIIKEKTPKAETIQSIFIVDPENHLVGSTMLRRLMVGNPQDNVLKAALKKKVIIQMEDEVKKIALLMDRYKFAALPVVDSANILLGIITIDDIFSRLVSIAWRRKKKTKQI